MAHSPSAGRQLYRRENDSIAIRCLAVGWLHRHPLDDSYIAVRMTQSLFAVSLWGGSIAIRWTTAVSP